MKNILTIGMAVHNDFKMLWATVQSLKLEITKFNLPIEILVVDNNAESVDGRKTERFIQGWSGNVRARYMVCPRELFGTTQSRQMVFDKSETEWTMCIDSHILLWPGALLNLVQWLQSPHAEDNRDNLFSGPILMDDLISEATHFDLIWDSEMWGKWGTAWWDHNSNEYFSVQQGKNEYIRANFIKLSPTITPHNLGVKTLYAGHEKQLKKLGYQTAVDRGYPFEIPAMGLGLFMARTESWLGFNRHMRGFGGEEGYIHTKYRNAGRRCICLPWLKWNHKFNSPEEINYSVDRRNKTRNYVLGFNEVGLSLKPVYEHFVVGKLLTQRDWDSIVSDPENYVAHKTLSPQEMFEKNNKTDAAVAPNLETCAVHDLYGYLLNVPRDLDKHLATLKSVAERSKTVVEFTHRRESTVGFMAGAPQVLISFQSENDGFTGSLAKILERTPFKHTVTWTHHSVTGHLSSPPENLPQEFDTLYIDTDGLSSTLKNYLYGLKDRIKRFIVVHDTHGYGETDPSGGQGLNYVLRAFCDDNPDWRPVFYNPNQYGLTILGCNPDDFPKQKIMAWKLNKGPGTELKLMNAELGIKPAENCSCNRLAAEMDWLGVQGCRDNRQRIVEGLKENSTKYKWTDFLMAGLLSATCSFVSKLNPLDIYGSMVDEAIRRAEENERATSGSSKV